MKPGAMVIADREIVLNEGKENRELLVANVGDRPVQVGSHYHFFEVNRMLTFDREPAFGFRLDIPSGTSVRFEPGEEKTVTLLLTAAAFSVYDEKQHAFAEKMGSYEIEAGSSSRDIRLRREVIRA